MKKTLLWLTQFLKMKTVYRVLKATKEDQRIPFSFMISNKLYIFKLWSTLLFFVALNLHALRKQNLAGSIVHTWLIKINLYSSPELICIYDVDDYAQKQRLSEFYRRWAWKNWGFLILKAIFRYVSQIS